MARETCCGHTPAAGRPRAGVGGVAAPEADRAAAAAAQETAFKPFTNVTADAFLILDEGKLKFTTEGAGVRSRRREEGLPGSPAAPFRTPEVTDLDLWP
ncbi:hypothetical protein [Streptomyces doebereineriae]|uniref:Uncharacterized protein n=1 Tax=Streptomyces doebereineriae TaxID=3075528 RepID=A0ABU2VII1_9ACTN|nr:hypothetical protein [Streptomyces sp. DSM 41640]MDT0485393.1 hypothetical protein [Streptomyces sp. DSM 41640]